MELIIINPEKLKIMLSDPDMRHYALSGVNLNASDEHTRQAFRQIFEDVRKKSGFDTAGERLFIQLYTSKGGGCEIFVTKLGPDTGQIPAFGDGEAALLRKVRACPEKGEAAMSDRQPVRPSDSRLAGLPSCTGTRPVTMVFPTLERLIRVCRRLMSIGYRGESRAYIYRPDGKPHFCLILTVPETGWLRLPDEYAFLAEYGTESGGDSTRLYLSEYGTPLCGTKAVEILGRL